MANIKGSKKRAELAEGRRTANRFNKKTARTAISRLRSLTDKKDAETFLKKVNSLIDRLAKKNTPAMSSTPLRILAERAVKI